MANLRVLLIPAVAALMLVPMPADAACTSPICPHSSVSGLTASPSSPIIPLGGSMTFNVTFTSATMTYTVCQAGTGSVAIATSKEAPAGITIGGASSLSMPIPQSSTQDSVSGAPAAPGAQLVVNIASTAPANHMHAYTVYANYTTTPSTCSNSAASGQESVLYATAITQITFTTGPGKGNMTTSGQPPCVGATCPTTPAGTSKASPLADVPFVALLVLGVALVASRRNR
ncbi:MAG: hypothetical protein V4510_03195 [bacterium]